MSAILQTNARMIIDRDGDISGYDLPDEPPVYIDTKWLTKWGREDELVYVVKWANGTWADMFSIPNEWHDIYLASIRKRHEVGMATLDATLSEIRDNPV